MTNVRDYDQVVALLNRVPRPPESPGIDGATVDQVESLESRLQQPLSPSLKTWLQVCNGAIAGPGVLLGTVPTKPELDIVCVQSLWPDWRENRWIPVATDGVGNAYVVAAWPSGSDESVYFVDCSEDPGSLAYVAGASLVAFLTFLLRKELGDDRWPFDASFVTAHDPAITHTVGAPSPWDA